MKTGIVKFFNESKGFGFIITDDSKQEVFVHHSGLIEKVRENDKVEFEVTQGKKGPNAVNVKIVK
jgi:CspA family cold shock protein